MRKANQKAVHNMIDFYGWDKWNFNVLVSYVERYLKENVSNEFTQDYAKALKNVE